jgi:hypothetical protein
MRHYLVVTIAFGLCASCGINDVSRLEPDLFVCQKPSECKDGGVGSSPDSAPVTDLGTRTEDAEVGFLDAMPDAGPLDSGVGLDSGVTMDASPTDTGFGYRRAERRGWFVPRCG